MSSPKCIAFKLRYCANRWEQQRGRHAAGPLLGVRSHLALRTLKTSEAAAVLNVSPNTLRAWERRFGYPKPQRSPGKHRLYTHGEVAALRDALQEGLSISSAVSRAREALSADTSILVGALSLLRAGPRRRRHGGRAGAALRRALRRGGAAAVAERDRRKHGCDSAPWAFAAQWANDWLAARPAAGAAAAAPGRRAHRRRHARRVRRRRARAAVARSSSRSAPAPACSSLPVARRRRPGRRPRRLRPAARRHRRRARRRRRRRPLGLRACAPPPARCRSRSSAAPATTASAPPGRALPDVAGRRPPRGHGAARRAPAHARCDDDLAEVARSSRRASREGRGVSRSGRPQLVAAPRPRGAPARAPVLRPLRRGARPRRRRRSPARLRALRPRRAASPRRPTRRPSPGRAVPARRPLAAGLRGVADGAERYLGVEEADAVGRHVTELLVPADVEAAGPEGLVNLVVHAARGEGQVERIVLRPPPSTASASGPRSAPAARRVRRSSTLADGRR